MRMINTVTQWRIASFLVCAICFATRADAAPDDWPMYNKTFDGQRFSSLAQVNAGNAATLKEACRIQVAKGGSFHTGLVVVGRRMYLTNAHWTFAIDAADCRLLWKASHVPEKTEVWRTNRGVAVMDGRVFRGTGDGRLIALDAASGRQLWKMAPGVPERGEFFSSAPIASNGKVFIGTAGSDWGIRGKIFAFDAKTGKEIWRFNTIPGPGQAGFDTWPSEIVARIGGGGTWSSFALDEQRQELFVPVGNPAPDFSPAHRPGSNLYTNSVVVLDSNTGKLKWWYQLTPNDGHDLDLGAAPVLFRTAQGRELVALAGKDGFVHLLDRTSHRLLSRTAVTTISNAGVMPNPEGVRVCPGAYGGVEWNGPSVDVSRNLLVVGSVDWCSVFSSGPVAYRPGELYSGGSYKQVPGAPKGWITALDASGGKVKWRYEASAPVVAGVTATAGGVVFTGDLNGNFLVLDSYSGKLLHQYPTGGAIAGGVITYAIGGQQYIATTSGNVSRTTFGVLGFPSIVVMTLGSHAPKVASRIDVSEESPASLGFDGEQQPAWREALRSMRLRVSAWFGAQSGNSKPAATAAATANAKLTNGKSLFAENCAGCHGLDRSGLSGPALTALRNRMSKDKTIQVIKHPGGIMPALYPTLLSETDVENIAAFLQEP
jgi:alcohol dehydrogenase (cytochrome c)